MSAPPDLKKILDDKITQLRKELEFYEALRQVLEKTRQEPPDLDKLPWKQYRDGKGEWIFQNEAPPSLVQAIEQSGGRAVINGYVYDMSQGSGGKVFIRRRKQQ